MLITLLTVANVLTGVLLVVVILLQRSDDSLGGAFGGANAGGANINKNPLARPTTILGTLFLVTALLLGWLIAHQKGPQSVVDQVATETSVEAEAELPTPAE